MNESLIKLSFQTGIREECVQLIFSFSDDIIQCTTKLESGKHNQNSRNSQNMREGNSLFNFASKRLKSICNNMDCKFNSSEQIAPTVQLFDWKLRRLELIQKELFRLRSRYETILNYELDETEDFFVFVVDFVNKSSTKKLRASFDVGAAYPFTPMEVSLEVLEGDLSIDDLSRQLISTTRPGYGYLSRACDILETFVN